MPDVSNKMQIRLGGENEYTKMPMEAYPDMMRELAKMPEPERVHIMRELCRHDLYFLLRYVLNRPDVEQQWLFDRCREVQISPNEHLDLWSREHYKSTIITFAKSIQDILASHGNNPYVGYMGREVTLGIFSFNRGIALDFLSQIKTELESNELLKSLFPDILYSSEKEAKRMSKSWSVMGGLIVKRMSNPKECTVEGWGLVDSMPTGRHFVGRIYDDVITEKYARSPEMIEKATESWELSLSLGSRGGYSRYVGTRYNYNDTYRTLMKRDAAKPRIYPATDDGTITGKPVLLTPEELAKKRKQMGPYVFGCHATGTKVLMADWTEKNIEDVTVGDMVIGYEKTDKGKTRLVPTEVVATRKRVAERVGYRLESGHTGICTPDHKWWMGRWREKSSYSALGFGYRDLDGLCRIAPSIPECEHPAEAGYLAGIIDADGSVSGGCIHIYQSYGKNKAVCERIERCLSILGVEYGVFRDDDKQMNDYYITGGRESVCKILNWCDLAKRGKIIELLMKQPKGTGYKSGRDKLVSMTDEPDGEVVNIQTTTGNYIADGYASKNCQMMQDPKADSVQGFKREWLNFYNRDKFTADGMNLYLLCDPANEKKKSSDYTTIAVIGIGPDGNKYLVDLIRDRLNLTERVAAYIRMHRRWRPRFSGYEKYGKDSDIQAIESAQADQNYRFHIVPLGGSMAKNDRIRRMIPDMENGIWYWPDHLYYTDYENKKTDLIEDVINNELDPFPVGVHDDSIDIMSRIYDEEVNAVAPRITYDGGDGYTSKRRRSAWSR